MSDSPADSVMAVSNPPGHGGACGAVSEPAPLFYSARHEQRAAEHEQRVHDRWTTTDCSAKSSVRQPNRTKAMDLRNRGAASTTTGKADAATDPVLRDLPARPFPDGADAAKPTLKPYWRRSPWWWWT